MTRVLILAQGDGRRWVRDDGTLPLGVPKHLVTIEGETLLARQVRLLGDKGLDVVVVGPDDDRYRVPGSRLVTLADPHPTGTSMDKLVATRHLWHPEGRTTITWGDCYYTEDAIARITAADSPDPHWYRRPGPSAVTGHRWDESFALTFLPEHHDELLALAARLIRELPAPRIHIWNLYAAYLGRSITNVAEVMNTPHQTHIDDWTDDFDSWREYVGWVGRRMAGRLDLAAVIPWVDTGCPHRRRAYEWTRRYWERHGVPVIVGGRSRGGEVSRAATRNETIAPTDAALLFIADADTIVPPGNVWAAGHVAQETGRLVVGYDHHVRLDQQATARIYTGQIDPATTERMAGRRLSSVMGASAVTRDLFDRVGGFDERFASWGAEDRAFAYAAEAIAGGPEERLWGESWHLWHPRGADQAPDHPGRLRNEALALRYKAAAGYEPVPGSRRRVAPADRDAVLAIMAEPGGPHGPPGPPPTTAVTVVVPYRETGPDRARHVELVKAHHAAAHPDWPVVVSTDEPHGSTQWCKGHAVNRGVARTRADVIVVTDGDVWVSADQLDQAVDLVRDRGGWAVPYNEVRRLTPEGTARVHAGEEPTREWPLDRPGYPGVPGGGIWVMSAADFYALGGMDTRFLGWGGEDDAWGWWADALLSRHHRIDGPCWHLWHPPAPQPGTSNALWRSYRDARTNPAALRAVRGLRPQPSTTSPGSPSTPGSPPGAPARLLGRPRPLSQLGRRA